MASHFFWKAYFVYNTLVRFDGLTISQLCIFCRVSISISTVFFRWLTSCPFCASLTVGSSPCLTGLSAVTVNRTGAFFSLRGNLASFDTVTLVSGLYPLPVMSFSFFLKRRLSNHYLVPVTTTVCFLLTTAFLHFKEISCQCCSEVGRIPLHIQCVVIFYVQITLICVLRLFTKKRLLIKRYTIGLHYLLLKP